MYIIYYTQLEYNKVLLYVSKPDVRSVTYFGGPRPRALGLDHAFGSCREFSSLMEGKGNGAGSRYRGVRGLIPRTSS
jgi:hypothetical protein